MKAEVVTLQCSKCGKSFERLARLQRKADKRGFSSVFCGRTCRTNMEERFWAMVDKRGPDECWPWIGAVAAGGYGQFGNAGKNLKTHRLAWELTFGPIPHSNDQGKRVFVCHTCDNPSCCNPSHFFLGDNLANVRDMISKGRQRNTGAPGVHNSHNKLTVVQVMDVLAHPEVNGVEFGKLLGVWPSAITKIRRGETWSHTTGIRKEK